ncbi:TPA: glycosyltransferase family 4 protein [Photobacterium damselae]
MKENLKIAFVLPSLANRGPIVFTKYLVDNLVELVDLVDIYYLDDLVDISFNCNMYKINNIKNIDFCKYDIIQTTMFRPDLYISLYKKTKRKDRFPIIISGLHNYINEDMKFNYGAIKGFCISKVWLYILKLFDGVVYSSNEMVNYYSDYLKDVPHKKIPYGINEISYENTSLEYEYEIQRLKNNNYKIIGAVGLLIKRKGFHQIIEALRFIDDHALVIIGSGPEELALKNLAKEYNLSDRVIFTGFQQNSKEYYKFFDIYCLCSYSEGFGLAMLEALSARIPLICSNLDIYNEYFCKKDVGLFEVDNINSLVSEINRVNGNYSNFSSASYKLFKRFFDVRQMSYEHVGFYKKLLNKKK